MVETADLGQFHAVAHAWRVDGPWLGSILAKRGVRSGVAVVGEVGLQDPTEMSLAEDDDMVEALIRTLTDEESDARVSTWRRTSGAPWSKQS
jgi:hypothetical protein